MTAVDAGQCPHGHMRISAGDPVAERLGLGAAALRYAHLGCAVLPLDRGGKRPSRLLGHQGGVHHATTDLSQIAQWWEQEPVANIGVATGRVSRLVVADLDVKRGQDGPSQLRQFTAASGLLLPPCPVVSTPSGGWHIWLRWPWDWRCPERPGILPGVDIKGDGGLVVAPPSAQLISPIARPGESRPGLVPVPYTWSGCPCQALPAPPWYAQWITTAPASGQPLGGQGVGGPDGDLDAGRVMAEGAPVGQRNATLYRLACSRYRRHGISGPGAALVLDELRRAWQAGDTTGMPWSEVQVIAWSARRFMERAEARERLVMAQFLTHVSTAGGAR